MTQVLPVLRPFHTWIRLRYGTITNSLNHNSLRMIPVEKTKDFDYNRCKDNQAVCIHEGLFNLG